MWKCYVKSVNINFPKAGANTGKYGVIPIPIIEAVGGGEDPAFLDNGAATLVLESCDGHEEPHLVRILSGRCRGPANDPGDTDGRHATVSCQKGMVGGLKYL